MKVKLLTSLICACIPVFSDAASITFDNRTANSSAIRLHVGAAGAGACSSRPMMQYITGNKGYTLPGEVNVANLTKNQVDVLCPGGVCRAELYMNQRCDGDSLALVTLNMGNIATVSPDVVGPYRFKGMVDGVMMECVDGSKNC